MNLLEINQRILLKLAEKSALKDVEVYLTMKYNEIDKEIESLQAMQDHMTETASEVQKEME